MTNSEARKRIQAVSAQTPSLSQPIPAPVDSGAIGRLNEAERAEVARLRAALTTIRTLARSWSGRHDLLMTGDSAAHDIEAALAAPTTTERSE